MKNLSLFCLVTISAIIMSFTTPPVGSYFDVYLVNKCSSEIDVKVRASGSSSTFDLDAGEKTKVSVKDGYEIYVDGDKVHEIEEDDKGDDIVICD